MQQYMSDINFDDIYFKHRSKFIIKLKDFVYPEEENIKNRKKGSSSIGESTDSDTDLSSSINKVLNFYNVKENKNGDKCEEKIEDDFNNNKVNEKMFTEPEIQINNNDDY